MTWISFYLVCFVMGLLLSALSLLGGLGHFGGHIHLPHAPHIPTHVHIPHGVPQAGHVPHGATTGGGSGSTVPWWNAFSIMVFLCWFGASGYLLTRYGGFVAGVVLVLAGICGVAGGAIIFLFLTRVMLAGLGSHPGRWYRRDCVRTTGRAVFRSGALRGRHTDSKTGRGICRSVRERDCLGPALGRRAGKQ